MKAAVVTEFDSPPRYQDFRTPVATGPNEMVVDVLGSGLHPRVRSQADGSHYTSTDELPLVPGIDGVGRDADGRLRYFVLGDTTLGAMAEQTVIDARRSVVLPENADPVTIAAGMNPAMSSWLALRRRAEFCAGQRVLVLGATGSAGRLAVQVATLLGAAAVIAAGRDAARLDELPALGATATVQLGDPGLGTLVGNVDVVLDYLWGEPAAQVMTALITNRADRSALLTWVQIGSVAGATAPLPSAALRAADLRIVGSGQGSISTDDIVADLPDLAAVLTAGELDVAGRAVPLRDVEKVWAADSGRARMVLMPDTRGYEWIWRTARND